MPNEPLQQQDQTATIDTNGPLKDLLAGPLGKRPNTWEPVARGIETFAAEALKDSGLIREGVLDSIDAMIAEIDKRLSAQMNLILHHAQFQKLEGSWRGLHHLVFNTETDEKMQIRVVNVSKKSLAGTLKKYAGVRWDQSPVFNMFYTKGYGTLGGSPFGALIGDYEFDHSDPDIAILGEMSKIAAAAHAPFISAAAPSLFMLDSWQDIDAPKDLKSILERSPDHAAWRTLRDSEDARYLGLCMPRFLSRMPYGPKTNPVDEFAFEEVTEGGKHDNFTWSNAAYLMGENITRSQKSYGWSTQIEGLEAGGAIAGLPAYTFPTEDGGRDMKCPTEISINKRRSAELSDCGLLALEHMQNSDVSVFIGSSSVQKPKVYDQPDATASSRLSARLAYLFAACRFTHYIEKMIYDKLGTYKSRQEMESWLNEWLAKYTLDNPERATDELKAKHPLQKASVEVRDIEGNPGYYSAKILLVPHYKVSGVTVSMSLVGRLPTPKS